MLAGANPSGAARRPNQAHSKDTATSSSPDLPRPSLASEAPGTSLSGSALHMTVHSDSVHCGNVSSTSAAPKATRAFEYCRALHMSVCESCNKLLALFDYNGNLCKAGAHAQAFHCCAAPGNALDALIGSGASPGSQLNSSIITERAAPGLAQNYASAGQQHNFDNLQGTQVGRSAQPQVSLHCSQRSSWRLLSRVRTEAALQAGSASLMTRRPASQAALRGCRSSKPASLWHQAVTSMYAGRGFNNHE